MIGCMKNEHSALYEPYIHDQIIRTASEIIKQDIKIIGESNVMFSNTDSIGFTVESGLEIDDLLDTLNDRWTYIKYKIENHFSCVKFINVNKYIGITIDNNVIIKGYPKRLSNDPQFKVMVKRILEGESIIDVLSPENLYLCKVVSDFDNCLSYGVVLDQLRMHAMNDGYRIQTSTVKGNRVVHNVNKSNISRFVFDYRDTHQMDEIVESGRLCKLVLDFD